MQKRQWYYRGSLKSCNYSCSYCPFSKQKGNQREWQKDQEDFFRFVQYMNSREDAGGAVQIVPYGEALIHPYYWEGMARLTQNPRLDVVGAQSNFSFPVDEMLEVFRSHGGVMEKLRLWGTFHPEMTTVEEFGKQCDQLWGQNVLFCVGTVGVPQHVQQIQALRNRLADSVYLWVNKMDGLGRNYTPEEISGFLEIDDYFEMELCHHKADIARCQDNRFVEADGTMHRCILCRQTADQNVCTRKECSCYLAYCNRQEETLLFFQPYPAFRIPSYPKAVFFDIDGTLIPEGQKELPQETAKQLRRLAKHSNLYFATSLPRETARRKMKAVWDVFHGGVFAGGGRWVVNGVQDEIAPMEAEWVDEAKKLEKTEGYTLHVYQKKDKVYKITFQYRKGKIPQKLSEDERKEFAEKVGVPDTCRLVQEEQCIQCIKKGTGKLEGILKICEWMQYDKNEIAVIGNEETDIPMLQYFPFSVAAKGSSAKVKDVVKYIL